MLSSLFTVATFAASALASWEGNINFQSPSLRHRSLGLDVPKIQKRQSLQARQAPANFTDSQLNFTHGVASGDPWAYSVILWTRLAPSLASDNSNVTVSGYVPVYSHETEQYIQASRHRVCATWKIASDPQLTKIVDSGTAYTTSDIDFTIKVEAGHLQPFTTYYYQFTQCGTNNRSPLGRTKSSPTDDDDTQQIGLAVYSCSNFPNGYFNAYGNAARKDHVDYVVHLGDYIYETSTGVLGRDPRATNPGRSIETLYDYRTRIAQYRTDLDLLLSHQNFAWIAVWDDHEEANNGYRDGFSAMNNTEQSFIQSGGVSVDQRKMNAVRAYFEWMPIRQVDMDDNLRIWRTFRMGKLMDLIMLDTRNYDRSITDLNWNTDYMYLIRNDASRSLMGSAQENWFYKELINSQKRGATWRIIGNQIVFSRVNISSWFGTLANPYNEDQWDGYQANRNRTFKTMYDYGLNNNVMLAGDSHANWVSDLVWLDEHQYNPATGEGSVGVEFAGTAVTSTGFGGTISSANNQSRYLVRDNTELQWNEGYYRGYFELHIGKDRIDAQYFGMPTVATRNPLEISLGNFSVMNGANHLTRPVAGGVVESGSIQTGSVQMTNLTYNTMNGTWAVRNDFNQMFITYPRA
ncbi:hypothetical protein BAUCODRAFT_36688 [Baudoinia panamericana UAMH 10762]|uniref:PhoD-like phosphatase metallophosphatase domain-containing protein n=1 Tax=Baudoinia panamericana (strain UAMH 10762) TaxID=717646 RepID=M2N599_BAUPA|nr:uncharacterized protein BAUCODRAFT_36688 [Baudoinia panamericana UAMH 10762]EMC94214.1 hypothetical protein BAUCODRAFT_36688 [Baudoinia panamericana UAMH 10762]